MSARYATPLHIDLQGSRYAAGWLLLVHAPVCSVPFFVSLPGWGNLLVVSAACASLAWHWSRHVTRLSGSAVCTLVWHAGRRCTVTRRDGPQQVCTLASRAFVMPWLVILYYRRGRWLRSLFILPDMLPASVFRHLRVRLRTEAGAAGQRLHGH